MRDRRRVKSLSSLTDVSDKQTTSVTDSCHLEGHDGYNLHGFFFVLLIIED